MVVQRNPEDLFLGYLNSKANSLSSGLNDFVNTASKFVSGSTSLSTPSYNNSLSSGDNTGLIVLGIISLVAIVGIAGIAISYIAK